MTVIDEKSLSVLKELRDAIGEEIDMDSVGPRFGQAVNALEELIEQATRFRRDNAYADQSKW